MEPQKFIFCFDIDGTLLSTNGAGTRSFQKATEHLFKGQVPWGSISMAGRLDPSIFNEILKHLGIEFTESLWLTFKACYLEYFAKESSHTQNWVVYPGVRELLDDLRAKDQYMILITGNIIEGARFKLDQLGLSDYFDWEKSIFGDHGRHQRSELAYAYLEQFNSEYFPVVIGDTPEDIKVGKILKGLSVAVATGTHTIEQLKPHDPSYLLSNLRDFPSHILSPSCQIKL